MCITLALSLFILVLDIRMPTQRINVKSLSKYYFSWPAILFPIYLFKGSSAMETGGKMAILSAALVNLSEFF